MHTCESSLGPFFSNTKKRKKSHLTSRLNQGLEESTTHNDQIQTVPCPSFALEEEEQSFQAFCGNDEILLWLLFLVWNSYVLHWNFLLNFQSGMIRDEPIEPIVSHRFPSFSLSAQSPRPASRKMSSTVKKKLKICPITWVKKNFPWLSMFKPFSKVIQLLNICQFISSRPMLFTFPPWPRSPLDWGLPWLNPSHWLCMFQIWVPKLYQIIISM